MLEAAGVDEVKVRTRADLRHALRHLRQVLRPRPRPRRPGQRRRGDRRDRGAVDRRAGHAADDAHVPHRRCGVARGGGVERRGEVATAIVGFNPTMRYVTNGKGELVVISRSGEIIISDQHGRERERHKVPYGALLSVKPDQPIKAGTVLANWDPLTRPIITEFAGRAKFENVEEGVTVAKQVDEVTGLSTLVVIDPKRRGATKVVRPQVKLLDAAGNEVKIPGTDHSVTIALPGRLADPDPRRPGPGARRGAGAHPGRRPEDARHHRRPAARGRAVRGPHAEGQGHAGRDDRHGVVRQGDQGQGAPADHRPGRQGLRGAGAEGKEHPRARGPGGEQGRADRRRPGGSAGHPAPAGHRGAGALHRRRGAGRLPPAGREDQRQAHRGDRSPDAAPRADRQPGRHAATSPASRSSAPSCWTPTTRRWPKASCRPRTPTCCWASPRRRCRPTASSRRRRSRRPRACSPRRPSWASATSCAA